MQTASSLTGSNWHNGILTDLGALPGVNSSHANWISANGLIAGFSQNGVFDPLLGIPAVNAVLWKDGEIVNLGTLEGGSESVANAVNNRGQVVGFALNTIPDHFSFLTTQMRAFLWQNGAMKDLGTLGGNDANAFFVNERGQIVGQSFTNAIPNPATGIPTQAPFLWENGRMLDLGTLGGTLGFPMALNNRGQVAGGSNLAGDLTLHPFLWDRGVLTDLGTLGGSFGVANWINDTGDVVGGSTNQNDQAFLAFLWRNGVMTNLGTLSSDACSNAGGINPKGQVVGTSAKTCTFTAADRRAFLWENGQIIDLNIFLRPGSSLQQLTDAFGINDRGEIAGLGVPPGCSDEFACGHAFLLIPCDGDHADADGCKVAADAVPATQTSANATQCRLSPEMLAALRARFGRRSHAFGPWPRN
jgi:probable HAF family extracellular repeat protein